jgi:hypothetical protein
MFLKNKEFLIFFVVISRWLYLTRMIFMLNDSNNDGDVGVSFCEIDVLGGYELPTVSFFALLWLGLWRRCHCLTIAIAMLLLLFCHYCCHWFSLPLSMARSVDDGARITYDEVEMLVVPVGARRCVLAAG